MSTHHLPGILAAAAALLMACGAASAHPHVWVTMKAELVYGPDGAATGVRHAWTFDDMFSVFATQGIDSKAKGEFTRDELAPLAKINVESLKDFDFFTVAKANGNATEFKDAVDYYLDYDTKETVLTLHFTLPFKAPVKAKELSLEVYDPSYFVDFSFAEKDAGKLVDAPAACKLTVVRPQEMDAEMAQRLGQLGADTKLDPSSYLGAQYANRLLVQCP